MNNIEVLGIEFRPFQTAFAYIFLLSGFLSWPNNIVITRQLERFG
jgi:hypothetical protein